MAAVQSQVLNAYAALEPQTAEATGSLWSKVWRVAGIAAAVAAIALCVGAVAFTGLYAVDLLPAVSLLVLAIGVRSTFNIFKSCWDKADRYLNEAKLARNVLKKVSVLKKGFTSIEALKTQIEADHEIKVSPHLRSVRATYALFLHGIEESKRLKEKAEKMLTPEGGSVTLTIGDEQQNILLSKYQIAKVDWTSKKEELIFAHLISRTENAYNMIMKAVERKLEAAYILKVMENPYLDKPKEHFFHRIPLGLRTRAFAAVYAKDPAAMAVATVGGKPLLPSEVLDSPPQDLAKRLYSVIEA